MQPASPVPESPFGTPTMTRLPEIATDQPKLSLTAGFGFSSTCRGTAGVVDARS